MTPEEQYRLLRETSAEINAAVDKAFAELMDILSNTDTSPQIAVQAVMDSLKGEYAAIIAAGLGVVLQESMGTTGRAAQRRTACPCAECRPCTAISQAVCPDRRDCGDSQGRNR